MDSSNPYQPPNSTDNAKPWPLPEEHESRQRVRAAIVFSGTVAGSLAFIYYALTTDLLTPAPGIVLIVATGMVSVATAIITRDRLFAPLCCFGGMMSGITLAAAMKDWEYVTLELTLPMTIVVSLPAWLIAWRLDRRKMPDSTFIE